MPSLRILIAAGLAVGAVVAAVVGFFVFGNRDVSHPNVDFHTESAPPATTPKETDPFDKFVWPIYGYTKDRRRYLPASHSLRPPFRKLWAIRESVLLEFSPVIGERSIYLLRNDGSLWAISKRSGRVRWKKRLGFLAAASPAYEKGLLYVTLLERSANARAGRVVALDAKRGKVLWSKELPSRTESSPLVDRKTLYFGSENGTVFALNAANGSVRWTYKARGAVKGGLALSDGKLYFGDYSGHVYCIRQRDGKEIWNVGTSGAKFGLGSGRFYSTAAVAYDRVYLGNTDGKVYSFSAEDGELAWRTSTGGYVYGSPAVAAVPGGKPTVYVGSYDGNFYAFDAKTGDIRWKHGAGGKISGGATVVGDIVYFANLGSRSTIGLNAINGRKLYEVPRGGFNPVVSDGRWIFLTGWSSLYALEPHKKQLK